MPGDVVLLPTGIAHILASAPDAATVPFDHLGAEQALATGQDLRLGAGPGQTRILCASYHQDPAVTVPLLTLLPDMLHIPARQAGAALDTTLRLLAGEISRPQPGASAVLDRIVEILLVQMLRAWLDTAPAPDRAASWLSALTDPIAGPALAALHTQPGRDWTIPSLATAIGVSRATLARRFPAQVGCTPAAYLTRWRMDLAAVRLRDTDDTVGAIARSLGYTSEYAFNRAFTRHRHLPPGRYRTRSRATRPSEQQLPLLTRHDGRPAAQGGGAVEPFDTTRPNIARVWDYWLGGKDNFAADRELAEKMLAVHPVTAQMARENRQFLGRAVSYVAARGVRQFIDVGAGLPTVLNTHDIARHTEPDARVAYVDNDPIVISHARSLLAKSPGVIAVPGDMRDPGRVLADPGLAELIDLAEPACVIISGVLHFVDPATARDIAGGFAQAVAPGSYLIISVGSGNPSEGENFTSAYTAARIHIHSRDEIQGFFGGLELVPPGVVSVRDWAGDDPALNLEPLTATFVAGVARKVNAN